MKTLKLPPVITVYRQRWTRGTVARNALLRDRQGYMDILGFCAAAAGVPLDELVGHSNPNELLPDYQLVDLLEPETPGHQLENALARNLVELNDDHDLSDADREQQMTEIMAEHGIELRFQDQAVRIDRDEVLRKVKHLQSLVSELATEIIKSLNAAEIIDHEAP